MIYNKMYIALILSICTVVQTASCRLNVPIREMTNAKKGITAAQNVKADKYAAEELESARKKLLESHSQVADKNVDGAKKSADESADLALAAYNKAVPLLAKDTISIAEKSFGEAGDVDAPRLAPDEYREADEKLKEANDQFQNKKYYEAYQSAMKADEKAKNARNAAIGKKDVLRDSIVEVKRTLDEADKYGAKKYAADKFTLASENVDLAEKAYDSLELKKGFSAVEVAKLNADEALLAALKNTAADRLAAAEKAVAQADGSKLAAQKKDELNAARESLEKAKSLLNDTKYKDSIAASDEAIRLSLSVMGKRADGSEVASQETHETREGTDAADKQVVEETDFDYYTVQYRKRYKDCLWYISRKFYRNPRLWTRIYNSNRDQIRNPNLIQPGWKLKIPRKKKK